MKISEEDRLDLRQEFERIFSNPRFAKIAMEAMPPIDDDRLATKDDLVGLGADVRGEMGRQMILAQLTIMMMLGGWVAATT